MLDIAPSPDVPAPGLDLGLTPDAPARAGAPERSPVQDLVRAGFDLAYDAPGDGLRGEAVQGLASQEARTFGAVRATDLLEAGAIAPPTDLAANEALAGVLRTPMGQQELVPTGLTGNTPVELAAGRPLGDDAVVLLDREAAAGFGHTAILVGNDVEGWTLHSKDGTDNRLLGGTLGRSTWTNENGQGQTDGGMSRPYATLDDFFRDGAIADRYEAAVRVEFEGGADRGAAARAGATAILREQYDVLQSSCAHTVENALEALQQNPNYGISGFNVRETVAFRGAIRPEVQFTELGRQEGRDDVRSAAQIAWQNRSEHDGR